MRRFPATELLRQAAYLSVLLYGCQMWVYTQNTLSCIQGGGKVTPIFIAIFQPVQEIGIIGLTGAFLYYFLSYGIVSMLAENIDYLKYFVVFDMLSCL